MCYMRGALLGVSAITTTTTTTTTAAATAAAAAAAFSGCFLSTAGHIDSCFFRVLI